jgi:hypothetical protein
MLTSGGYNRPMVHRGVSDAARLTGNQLPLGMLGKSGLGKGYQSMVTQAWVGVVVNALAEYAPDIKRMLHKNKKGGK